MSQLQSGKEIKLDRVMELFLRAMKGESLSAKQLALEYNVSTRSITRDLNNLKNFLAEHRDVLGYCDLIYSSSNHCYTLQMDHFLSNKELLAITKVIIGSRAFSNQELLEIIKKLKANTICLKVKQDTFVHKWYGRHGYSDLSVDEEEPQFIWMTKNMNEIIKGK